MSWHMLQRIIWVSALQTPFIIFNDFLVKKQQKHFIAFQIVCNQIHLHWSRSGWTHDRQSEPLVSKGCYPTTILCALPHTILYYFIPYRILRMPLCVVESRAQDRMLFQTLFQQTCLLHDRNALSPPQRLVYAAVMQCIYTIWDGHLNV